MPRTGSIVAWLTALLLLSSCATTPTGALSAAAALEIAEQKASDVLNKAENTGDYLAGKAAVEAMRVIDHLRRAYRAELDKSLSAIRELRDSIADVNLVLSSAEQKLSGTLDRVADLETRVNQLLADTPFGKDGSRITLVTPTYLSRPNADYYHVRLSGIDLYDIEVQPPEEGGANARVTRIDETTFLLRIPQTWIEQPEAGVGILELGLVLVGPRRFFIGPREREEWELTLGVLPKHMGVIRYSGISKKPHPENRTTTRNPGQFRGKDETVKKWVNATEGWTIDITKPIKVKESGADKGRCQGHSTNETTSQKILLLARVDKIKGKPLKYPRGAPGRVNCTVTFSEFREVKANTAFSETRDLLWASSEVIELPEATEKLLIEVQLFDGTVVKDVGSTPHPYFSIRREGDRLVITPKPPQRL